MTNTREREMNEVTVFTLTKTEEEQVLGNVTHPRRNLHLKNQCRWMDTKRKQTRKLLQPFHPLDVEGQHELAYHLSRIFP